MTALKCDRCGKLYEAYYLTEEYTKSPYRFYRIEKRMIPDNYSYYLDLCPDCQKELGEWIENGKEWPERRKSNACKENTRRWIQMG